MLWYNVVRKTRLETCFSRNIFRPRSSFNRSSRTTTYRIQPPLNQEVETVVGIQALFKPFVFTACFGSGAFICCSIWQYEDMRKRVMTFVKQRIWFEPTYKRGELRRLCHTIWHNQTDGQKVASVIITLNVFVFMLWRIQRLHPFMIKYFSCNPSSKTVCLPMFLSTFSHYNFFHMAANMYVLYSFSNSSVDFLGQHQFVAVYCSAGVLSSFTSCLYKVLTKSCGPSLGASGALMAILSSCCFQFPQAQLSLIFFPFFTVSAGQAIKFVMALDIVGMVAKWKVLDHAAHLGGACYGIFYYKYGNEYIWGKRERVVTWWHELREKLK